MQVLIPIIGLMLNVLIQNLVLRYAKQIGLLKSVFIGFGGGMVIVFLVGINISFGWLNLIKMDMLSVIIVNLITYSLFGYCYFHFINLGETARRIRILRELYESREGLSMKEILEKYSAEEIIEKRISRLIHHGQIVLKDGRYYIGNPSMLFIAKIIYAVKFVVFGKGNEWGRRDTKR